MKDQDTTATEGQHSATVSTLRDSINKLRTERQQHVSAIEQIDSSLAEVREILGDDDVPAEQHAPSKGRGRRGGKSGTQIIEEILERHNGSLLSSKLAAEASKRGVAWPHSSLQSLKKRDIIEIDNGTIRLKK